MKIIVAIANYGMKNAEYAKQLIQEYRSMPFEVDIFVLSEAPKNYGKGVTVLVGLPSKDPWSLPFAHKRLFAENVDRYDLFIYTEDDMLIRKANILAFLRASEKIDDSFLPGFVQYELYPNGKKNYPQADCIYHWVPGSVRKADEYVFAKFSNAHSACYILTQTQLHKALVSGGFLVPPHKGRYDLLCSAATDPYTQCGFTRVICLSHLRDFELHHLPNRYLNLVGLDENGYKLQIEALQEVFDKNRPDRELFITEKPLATPAWDKNYYEPCRYDIVRMISDSAQDILSVGCGSGLTEAHLQENGKRVMAIPLDSVIGRLAEEQGISVLPPDFEQAFETLAGNKFDAIVLPDILQHLSNPVEILTKLGAFLSMEGVLVGNVPNLTISRRLFGRLLSKSNKFAELNGGFNNTRLNMTSVATLKKWLKASGFHVLELQYNEINPSSRLSWLIPYLPSCVIASSIVVVAKRI